MTPQFSILDICDICNLNYMLSLFIYLYYFCSMWFVISLKVVIKCFNSSCITEVFFGLLGLQYCSQQVEIFENFFIFFVCEMDHCPLFFQNAQVFNLVYIFERPFIFEVKKCIASLLGENSIIFTQHLCKSKVIVICRIHRYVYVFFIVSVLLQNI